MKRVYKTILLTTIFLFSVTSCDRLNNYKLYIVLDEIDSSIILPEIIYNGKKIGTVDKLGFYQNKYVVTAIIDKGCQIPQGSTFIVKSVDHFDRKSIVVTFDSTAKEYYSDKDTVIGLFQKESFIDTTLTPLDSSTRKNLQPFMDTLEHAIKNLGKSFAEPSK